ncbi:MAG: hypothetical protein KJ799_14670 [Bacteroidetes bacterium]|nr:hypothetical protein [Bacteroidota bacterium]
MNIFELEHRKDQLLQSLADTKSPRQSLVILSSYFDDILAIKEYSLLISYSLELIPDYLEAIRLYTPMGVHPIFTENIIKTAKKLLNSHVFYSTPDELGININQQKEDLLSGIAEIERKLKELIDALNGKINNETGKTKTKFPVMEINADKTGNLGLIESISIIIQKNRSGTESTYDTIPALQKNNQDLENQIITSIDLAENFVKHYARISLPNNYIIKFKNKYGEYVGDSLGVALTITLISELFLFYKARNIFTIPSGVISTGSINKNGNVEPVSETIVKSKTHNVFFSTENVFVVPEPDKIYAQQVLMELKKDFPKRELKIVGVETLDDIIDDRKLVNIQKQNILVWGAKKAYNPKFAFSILLIFLIALSIFLYKKFDDNPDKIIFKNDIAFISNKMGDTLFTTTTSSAYNVSKYIKLLDINNDGINEVLISNWGEKIVLDPKNRYKLFCIDKYRKEIWDYRFEGIISDQDDFFENLYQIKLMSDDHPINFHEIIISAEHYNYYPSAILRLGYNGIPIGDTLWNPGTYLVGFIKDIDNDGRLELVGAIINNGFERSVLFSIELDKLKGRSPSVGKYRFPNFKIAEFEHYILLPKSDYNSIFAMRRYNIPTRCSFSGEPEILFVKLLEDDFPSSNDEFRVRFNPDFSFSDIVIGDEFRILRDSVIAKGLLSPPYTSTKEFSNSLRNQIKYWTGKEFVPLDKWDGKQASKPDSLSVY